MAINLRGVTAVLLPGTGSDEDYLRRAFSGPLTRAGMALTAVSPEPHGLVAGYLRALDAATGPIVVGGVSIGAAVATRWALAHPGRAIAILAVLPPWTGSPDGAPAAVSARHTADQLRRAGLTATTAAMRSSSPAWLADELSRSWHRQWPGLPDAMDEAAGYPGPSAAELGRMTTPMAVVAAPDDVIHPSEIALEWTSAVPRAAMRTVTLEQFGPDPSKLGAAGLAALRAIA